MFHDPWGFMWFGPLFWIIILAIVVFFIVSSKKNKHPGNTANQETPLDILKKRYTRGEITKEQYEQMKKDID